MEKGSRGRDQEGGGNLEKSFCKEGRKEAKPWGGGMQGRVPAGVVSPYFFYFRFGYYREGDELGCLGCVEFWGSTNFVRSVG